MSSQNSSDGNENELFRDEDGLSEYEDELSGDEDDNENEDKPSDDEDDNRSRRSDSIERRMEAEKAKILHIDRKATEAERQKDLLKDATPLYEPPARKETSCDSDLGTPKVASTQVISERRIAQPTSRKGKAELTEAEKTVLFVVATPSTTAVDQRRKTLENDDD